jgi:ABC-type branched-subunit amino acid transport system substrate-binding protein
MKRSTVYFVAGLLCLLAGDGAFAQKKYDPGATDTEIKIGQNAPFSGPASSYSILSRVQSAYLKAINERGGINGRKITLLSRDDGYSPPKSLEVIRQLVEDDQVLAIVSPFGTPTNAAMQKYLNTSNVPQLLVQSGCVYRKPRFGSNGDEVHQGSGVNERFRSDESDEKSAHPCAKTDAF